MSTFEFILAIICVTLFFVSLIGIAIVWLDEKLGFKARRDKKRRAQQPKLPDPWQSTKPYLRELYKSADAIQAPIYPGGKSE